MPHSTKVILKGFYWNAIQLVINQFFSFVVRLVLARLLFPEQFGLIGMAVIFIGFIRTINELGITAALIQREEEQMNLEHYHTSFWSGLVWSLLLFLVMSFAVAPLGAWFYDEPILETLIIVMSISIMFTPFSVVNKAILTRKMNFKSIAKVENSASFIAGVISIVLAFSGAGVWALAFNSVAVMIIVVPLYLKFCDWRPKFIWEKQAFKDIFGFGMFTSMTNLINYLINNFDYLVIGKLVSAEALGAYTFAFILTDTVKNRIASVISNVMYPVYSKLQSDKEKSKALYNRVVEYNCILIYPIMLGLFIFAEPLIINIFGEKWVDSVYPSQLLAAAAMIQLLVFSNTTLIRGLGFANFEFRLQFIKALIYMPILFAGIYLNGIIGAAWAVLINRAVAVVITIITFRLFKLNYTFNDFYTSVKTPFLATIASGLVGYALYHYANLNYILAAIVMLLLYAGIIYWKKGSEVIELIKSLKK
ncbi:MAG: lipopolysaccharide biosynthesis protein [Pricia sp.]